MLVNNYFACMLANSSFAFWNFLKFFFQIFFIHSGLNLWIQNQLIQRTDCISWEKYTKYREM